MKYLGLQQKWKFNIAYFYIERTQKFEYIDILNLNAYWMTKQ